MSRWLVPFLTATALGALLAFVSHTLHWTDSTVYAVGLIATVPLVLWGCWWTFVRGQERSPGDG
jgi:hypothetical protein